MAIGPAVKGSGITMPQDWWDAIHEDAERRGEKVSVWFRNAAIARLREQQPKIELSEPAKQGQTVE